MSSINPSAMRGALDLSALRQRHQTPPSPANPTTTPTSGVVVDVTDGSFGQYLELSRQVPVVVSLWAEWAEPSQQQNAVLESVTKALGGRLVLALVDVEQSPQLVQGFRVESVPTVVGLIAGQPVPLFAGPVPEEQVRAVFEQLLQLAVQQGVTGTVGTGGTDREENSEPALPPHHAEAFAAIERGDYDAAVGAYEAALADNPRDDDAKAGLAQVQLLQRVSGVDLNTARAEAAAEPLNVARQFLVADLDVAGGHVADALDRLLELFQAVPTDEKQQVRERLVTLFALVGPTDSRVIAARGRLTSLLF